MPERMEFAARQICLPKVEQTKSAWADCLKTGCECAAAHFVCVAPNSIRWALWIHARGLLIDECAAIANRPTARLAL